MCSRSLTRRYDEARGMSIKEKVVVAGITGAFGFGLLVVAFAASFFISAGMVWLIAWLSGWYAFSWKLAVLVWVITIAVRMALK